jgi:dephospho-CoA kinase
MVICIVGKSGSGKSTISNMLEKYSKNIIKLDVDLLSHKTLEIDEVKNEILNKIGNVFDDNFNVDRKLLSKIVFNNHDKLSILNNISWKYIEIMIDNFLEENKDKIVIIDWLLSPLTKYFSNSDLKILVDADYNVRKNRVIKRDNIDDALFYKRELASIDLNKYKYDYIINNNYGIKESEVEKIYDKSIIYRKF